MKLLVHILPLLLCHPLDDDGDVENAGVKEVGSHSEYFGLSLASSAIFAVVFLHLTVLSDFYFWCPPHGMCGPPCFTLHFVAALGLMDKGEHALSPSISHCHSFLFFRNFFGVDTRFRYIASSISVNGTCSLLITLAAMTCVAAAN